MLWSIFYKELLLFLTIAQTASGSIQIFNNEESGEIPLMKCFSLLSKSHLNSYMSAVTIYKNNCTAKETVDSLLNILKEEQIPYFAVTNKKALQTLFNMFKGKMVVVSYYETCEVFLLNVDVTIIDIRFQYLFIIDSPLDGMCLKTLKEVLISVRNYDITFLTKDPKGDKYNIESFILEIDEITCTFAEILPMQTINSCNNGSFEYKVTNVFRSNVPTNFKKCNFNIGMATLFPYSMLENKESYKNLDSVDGKCYGADVEFVKILAEKFNFTLKLYYFFREEENPYLHFEFLGYLYNKTFDACAGGLYRIYGDVVAYSGIYSGQTVIWVYFVEREIRSWQSLAVKITGLYIFLIFYFVYAILFKVMSTFDNMIISIKDTLFYSWGALVGASGLQDARSLKLKILNVVYLILCIHLSSYISTQIYYYLTIAQPPQTFQTVDELATSDKTPYLRFLTKYFIDEKKHEIFVNTSRDCDNFRHCEEIIMKEKGSTIIIDGDLPSLQSSTAVNDEARLLKVPENILFVYHEMLMRKDHILVGKFDKITRRLFEAGICHKLYVEAIGITVVDKARIVNANILANSYSCVSGCQITLRESAGAFYLWVFGCIISCFTLILEVILNNKIKTVAGGVNNIESERFCQINS